MTGEPRWARWAIPAGALLGALGWWLPWVLPESGAAALVLLGLDLGEFWKFTREWRLPAAGGLGLFEWERHFFFLPPALAAMILALWIAGQRGRARWLLLPLLLFLSLVILPEYPKVQLAFDSVPFVYEQPDARREFTFQLYLATASLLTILLIPLWQRVRSTARLWLISIAGLIGAALPAWALWRTWLVLNGLYGGSALLGPGLLVTVVGFALVTFAALLPLLQGRIQARRPYHHSQASQQRSLQR